MKPSTVFCSVWIECSTNSLKLCSSRSNIVLSTMSGARVVAEEEHITGSCAVNSSFSSSKPSQTSAPVAARQVSFSAALLFTAVLGNDKCVSESLMCNADGRVSDDFVTISDSIPIGKKGAGIPAMCFISHGSRSFINGRPMSKPGSGVNEECASGASDGLMAPDTRLARLFLVRLTVLDVAFFLSCCRTGMFDADDDGENTTDDDILKASGTIGCKIVHGVDITNGSTAPDDDAVKGNGNDDAEASAAAGGVERVTLFGTVCAIDRAASPDDNGASGGGSDCWIDPGCFAGSPAAPDDDAVKAKDSDDAEASTTTYDMERVRMFGRVCLITRRCAAAPEDNGASGGGSADCFAAPDDEQAGGERFTGSTLDASDDASISTLVVEETL